MNSKARQTASRTGAFRAKASLIGPLIFALTAIITTTGLHQSLRTGRLSVPPLYDDVSYFAAAAQWLANLSSRSISASLYALLDQHAPFATWTAIVGFLLTPDSYVGHYAINFLFVGGFLLGIARLAWHAPPITVAACLIGTACVPMLTQTIAEARPDLSWGLALGLVLVEIVRRPFVTRKPRTILLLGLLAGLAAIMKPSALPASLASIAGAAAIAVARDWSAAKSSTFQTFVKHSILPLLLIGAGCTAAVAPLLFVRGDKILAYILQALIYNRDFWAYPGTAYQQAIFYSYGLGGKRALESWFWLGLALFVLRFAVSFRTNRSDFRNALALLATVAVAYLIPTLSEMKSYFVGAMFYATFIAAMTLNFVAIIDQVRVLLDPEGQLRNFAAKFSAGPASFAFALDLRDDTRSARFRRIVCEIVPLVFVVAFFAAQLALGRPRLETVFDPPTIRDIRQSTDRLWSAVLDSLAARASGAQPAPRRPLHVELSSAYPVNSTTIRLYAARTGQPVTASSAVGQRTLEAALTQLLRADLIAASSSMPHNLPGARMGDEIIRSLNANPALCLLASVELAEGRTMRIYRKREVGCPDAPGSTR